VVIFPHAHSQIFHQLVMEKLVKMVTDYIPGTSESNAINDDLRSNSATLTLIPGIQIITQPQSVEVACRKC